MGLLGVFGDAARLYVLLWKHSLPAAALAQAGVWAIDAIWFQLDGGVLDVVVGLIWILMAFGAPVLVQGMLIKLVEDVHEGRRATEIRELVGDTARRLPALLAGTFLYWAGVVLGMVALIVPGLIALARWCLVAPFVVLERRGPAEAITKSSQLVYGKTVPVLVVVLAINALELWLPDFLLLRYDSELLQYGALVLVTPYVAHVLSALYYRLADPERPVVAARRPGSPWDEHALDDARRAG